MKEIEAVVEICEQLLRNLTLILYTPYFPQSLIHRYKIEAFEKRLDDYSENMPNDHFDQLASIMHDLELELKSALNLYGVTEVIVSNLAHQQRIRDDIRRLSAQFALIKDHKANVMKSKIHEATKLLAKINKLETDHGLLLLKSHFYRNSITESSIQKKPKYRLLPSFSIFKSPRTMLAQVKPQLTSKSKQIEILYGNLIKICLAATIFVKDNPDMFAPMVPDSASTLVSAPGLRLSF